MEVDSYTEIVLGWTGKCEIREGTAQISKGWAPAGDGTISSEDRVARNFEAPRAREISILE